MKMMKNEKSKRKNGKRKSKRKNGKSKLKVRMDGAKTIQELIIENIYKYNLYDLLYKRHYDFKKTHGFERVQLVNYISENSVDCKISIATYNMKDQLINRFRFDELRFKYFNLGSQKFFSNDDKKFFSNDDKKDLSIFIIGDKVRVKVPALTNIITIKIWINIEENDNLIYIDYSRIVEKEPIIKLVLKLYFDCYAEIFPNDQRFDKKGLFFLLSENRIEKLLDDYISNKEQFNNKIMNSIYKYQYCNYLDFDEKIECGFFDPGEQKTETISSSIGHFMKQKGREIILCDYPDLVNLVKLDMEKIPRHGKNYIEVIIQIVESIIKPTPADEGPDICVKYKNNNDPYLNNNMARLSNIEAGVCRHRSILFKFIIDNIETLDPYYDPGSTPLRCSLERGRNNEHEKHAWCTYSIGDKINIYDPWKGSISVDKFKQIYGVSSFGGGNTVAIRRDD